jgi:hypothetical protein
MNNQAIVASLVTLVVTVLTVAAGFLLKRRRYELLDLYAQRLTDERLKRYPELYKVLSSALKVLDYPDEFPDGLDLASLRTTVNEWDSSWGVLLTVESGDKAQQLRRVLHDLSRKQPPLAADETTALHQALVGLEIALRVDLGVYALEYVSIKPGFRRYRAQST